VSVPVCIDCGQPEDKDHECVRSQRAAMARLLDLVGDPGTCKGCGKEIIWIVHKNGKRVPYTQAGLNHFIDCPFAEKFRRVK
jgi:hypothetical protein